MDVLMFMKYIVLRSKCFIYTFLLSKSLFYFIVDYLLLFNRLRNDDITALVLTKSQKDAYHNCVHYHM